MTRRAAPTSCVDCLAWGLLASHRCAACTRFASLHPAGHCAGCSRRQPVHKRYCRLCWSQARANTRVTRTPTTAESCLPHVRHHQLFFAHMNPRCGRDKKLRRVRQHGRIGRPRKPDPPPASRPPDSSARNCRCSRWRATSPASLVSTPTWPTRGWPGHDMSLIDTERPEAGLHEFAAMSTTP